VANKTSQAIIVRFMLALLFISIMSMRHLLGAATL
jgi:hypothetical protein